MERNPSPVRFLREERILSIPVTGLPKSTGFLTVRTFLESAIMRALGRQLICRTGLGELEGDLADSWTTNGTFDQYEFLLKHGIKFSDGSAITARDVKYTFDRVLNNGEPLVHFADPDLIQSVEVISEDHVRFVLSKPARDFTLRLTNREFSIVPSGFSSHSDYLNDFTVTSGSYSVESGSSERVILRRNPHFLPEERSLADKIVFLPVEGKDTILDMMLSRQVNYFLPTMVFTSDQHQQLIENGWKTRNSLLGFSFFVAINPTSSSFHRHERRLWMYSLLRGIETDWSVHGPFNRPSRQIYVEEGPGRLTTSEIEHIEREAAQLGSALAPNTRISLLVSESFLLKQELINALTQAGLQLEIVEYQDFKEYAELIKGRGFDLVQANNDFSQTDLIENLRVTFNPGRPLIWAPEGDEIFDLLEKVNSVDFGAPRHEIIAQIGRRIHQRAYAVPIFHFNAYDYALPDVDLSRLSTVEPEFLFWKMRLN